MNKDEILRQAQAENRGADVADLDAQKKGAYFAYMIGVCLIVAVDIIEGIILHRISYGCNMAILVMLFAAFLIKYRTLRKRHELFVATCYAVLALAALALWILQLCGVIG